MLLSTSKMSGRARRACASAVVGAVVLAGCSSDADDADVTEVSEATDAAAATAEDMAAAQAELAAAQAELAAARERLAGAEGELATAQSEVASLTADLDATNAANADLTTQVNEATERAVAAEEILSVIGDSFPFVVDASIDQFDIIGRYDVTFDEAFCEGSDVCGTTRAPVVAEIIQGTNGLELIVPGLFEAGLLRVEGALMAATDSDRIATCAGAQRVSRVSVTLFGDVTTIDADGSIELAGLGAGIFAEAPPSEGGACGAANVFLSARLTRIAD